jgi:peptidoglycan/LPS O-acetylase OafA/YrhL
VLFHVWALGSPGGPVPLGPVGPVMPYLPLGVTLFFVLSGFLLYRPFAAAIVRQEPAPKVASYFRNRALRIVPAYWVILLVTGLALRTTLIHSLPDLQVGSLLQRPVAFEMDAFLVQNYARSTIMTGIGPAWSLAIELVFYLVLPLLAISGLVLARRAAAPFGRALAALAPAFIIMLVGISGKLVATFLIRPIGDPALAGWTGTWNSVIERGFWVSADFFAFGMVVAVLRVAVEHGSVRLPSWWRVPVGAGLVVVAVSSTVVHGGGHIDDHVYGSLMALACGLLLALVVLEPVPAGRPALVVRLLDGRIISSIGLVSYSLFLWHEPLIRWMNGRGLAFAGRDGFLLNFVVMGGVAILLSALTYRFVELPALRRKRRTGGRTVGEAEGRGPGLPREPGEGAAPGEPVLTLREVETSTGTT